MILTHRKEADTHLSHIHRLVSAYATNDKTVADLSCAISWAKKEAKKQRESIVVCQDCLEHILVIHPSGTISLYRQISDWEVGEE